VAKTTKHTKHSCNYLQHPQLVNTSIVWKGMMWNRITITLIELMEIVQFVLWLIMWPLFHLHLLRNSLRNMLQLIRLIGYKKITSERQSLWSNEEQRFSNLQKSIEQFQKHVPQCKIGQTLNTPSSTAGVGKPQLFRPYAAAPRWKNKLKCIQLKYILFVLVSFFFLL